MSYSIDRAWLRLQNESGAGTIAALAIVVVAVSALALGQIPAQQLIQQERLQVLADQTALAATDALRGLAIGYPCPVAEQLAKENMGKLVECRIVGFETFITLRSDLMGIVLIANARAGPS